MPTLSELEAAVRTVADTAATRRAEWDALDAATGDGDFGSTLHRGFAAVLEGWDALDRDSERAFLADVSRVLAAAMGGTSGPIWSVGVLRAGVVAGEGGDVDAMLTAAVDGIQALGEAQRGDKTLLDALIPAAEAARGDGDVAGAALEGAEATRELRARRGRGAYAGHRTVGTADPGAVAIAVLAVTLSAGDGDAQRLEALHRVGENAGEAAASGSGDADAPAKRATTKQLVNRPQDAAREALEGLALAHGDLVAWDGERRILTRADGPARDAVALMSGGGSGHEPLHGGFIGDGMLTAVAPGEVFASPSVDQVLAAIRAADGGAGVLQIIKNYTGDVLNFRLAGELAREEGLQVDAVIVADDVASGGEEHGVGRRGTGATLVVEKVAGARAAAGGSLEEVAAVARRAADRSASMGLALHPCSPPGAGPLFALGDEEVEMGVGIHGELGTERIPYAPVDELVTTIVDRLLGDLEPADGTPLLAFVNGFGGSAALELYIVYRALSRTLGDRGLTVARSLVGDYVTSLDMAGMSITLTALDDELTTLWDAPVRTPALRW
ncbi:dihydroxyacetone kinase subunit DhaK [Baekduia sp. Peel2402]|uniref:dihydroxyacetone kinase subunit DhaK n=1 Tax=Baekduia sp. Peel2402 TaxID=3458296 RepID=UPI00403EF33C